MKASRTPGKQTVQGQQMLFQGCDQDSEHSEYLSKQLITYIGNKRSLLGHIDKAIFRVKERLGKNRLRIFDAFAGSGVVSRFFKRHADLLVSNDLEGFAAVAGRCFLRNRGSVNLDHLRNVVDDLNERVDSTGFAPGFIEELYAPRDESNITDERPGLLHPEQRPPPGQLSQAPRRRRSR